VFSEISLDTSSSSSCATQKRKARARTRKLWANVLRIRISSALDDPLWNKNDWLFT